MKMAQEISLDQSTLKLLNHWAKNDNPIQDKHSEFRRMWNDAQYWKTLCTQRHSIRSWEEMRRIHFEPVFLSAADEWHGSDAVIFLLEQDINPNIQDASGRSALHKIISYAIFEAPNALNALKLLLQKGANTTLKDENGQTVFDELQKHTDSPVYQQIKSLLEENSQKAAAQQQVALPSLLAGPTVSSLLKSPLKQNSPPDEREKKFDSDDEPEGPAAASPLRHNVAAAKENDQPPKVIAAIKTIRDLFDEVALGNIQILENEKTKIMYFIFEEARKEMAGPVADAIEVLIPGTKAKKPGEKGMRVMPRDFSPNQDGTDLKISAGITSEQFTTLMDKCGSQTKLNFLIGKQNRYLTELGEIKDLNSLQAKEVRRKLEDIQEQMTEVADELQGRAPIVARENATRMSQHNRPTQIDENNKIVSQDLPKPYTIEYDIRSGWEFRLPKNAPDYHINPEELLAVLPKLTGMTPKHCGMLLQAIKADNEKRTDANVMKFFNDTMQADSRFAFRKKCPGVGEYLNGKEYCIESDERYLERSTKYIASLKKSIEGGADVLRLEKQFYGNGQDEKRKEIIQQALEANGYIHPRAYRLREDAIVAVLKSESHIPGVVNPMPPGVKRALAIQSMDDVQPKQPLAPASDDDFGADEGNKDEKDISFNRGLQNAAGMGINPYDSGDMLKASGKQNDSPLGFKPHGFFQQAPLTDDDIQVINKFFADIGSEVIKYKEVSKARIYTFPNEADMETFKNAAEKVPGMAPIQTNSPTEITLNWQHIKKLRAANNGCVAPQIPKQSNQQQIKDKRNCEALSDAFGNAKPTISRQGDFIMYEGSIDYAEDEWKSVVEAIQELITGKARNVEEIKLEKGHSKCSFKLTNHQYQVFEETVRQIGYGDAESLIKLLNPNQQPNIGFRQ